MTKTHKAVLRSSLVMLSLLALAVVSSGVAQAQECFARRASGSPNAVRAEGMTELLGGIEVLCNGGGGTGFSAPDTIEISIELNTSITNRTNDDTDAVMGLTYTDTDGVPLDSTPEEDLGDAGDYSGTTNDKNEVLSDDGMAITWEILSETLGISTRDDDGGTVVIRGLMADASAVGNGEDITVTVMVSGLEATGSPVKLADVTTGLDIEVTAATGLQCDGSTETATIMFTEGFNSAITAVEENDDTTEVESARNSVLVLNFRGIPDGVTVMASLTGKGTPLKEDMTDLAPLDLVTGEDEGADEDGMVTLSSVGAGEVMYKFNTSFQEYDETDPMAFSPATDTRHIDDGTKEWNTVEITFKWKAGEPPLDMGTVTVSYAPVSSDTDDIPRYVSGPTNDVIKIGDCTTTLLFPFVTNKHGFNTGLAITNASEGSGSCTLEYSGSDAPDDMTSQPIAGGAQWVNVVSSIAPEFQGFMTASCEFRDAHGFAFITGGGTPPTLAQGYLAVCTDGCDD